MQRKPQMKTGPVTAFDYIELYVGNPRQARYFYESTVGLQAVGHAGLETGMSAHESIVLTQSDIRFVMNWSPRWATLGR